MEQNQHKDCLIWGSTTGKTPHQNAPPVRVHGMTGVETPQLGMVSRIAIRGVVLSSVENAMICQFTNHPSANDPSPRSAVWSTRVNPGYHKPRTTRLCKAPPQTIVPQGPLPLPCRTSMVHTAPHIDAEPPPSCWGLPSSPLSPFPFYAACPCIDDSLPFGRRVYISPKRECLENSKRQ